MLIYRAQLLSDCLVGCRACWKRSHKVLTKSVEQAHATQPIVSPVLSATTMRPLGLGLGSITSDTFEFSFEFVH